MKNIRLLILAAALVSPAFAIDWSVDGVYNGSYLKFLTGTNGNSSYTSSFSNITTAGFNSATHTVTSASASFWFADDESDTGEQVDIFVNGIKIAANLEVDGTHPQATFAKYSFAISDAATLTALQSGPVSFKVQLLNGANGGDTYLKIAGLVATGTTRNNNNVPDGGSTAAMLGLGLIGLAVAGRRSGLTR